MKKLSTRVMLASVAVAALAITGCSASGTGDNGDNVPATGEPIKVAAISSMLYFPEASPAAQAVFDDYNTAGGFNGRPIELAVFDDKGDPAAAATAARDALSSDAVALVGSSSMLECLINHQDWVENDIVSLTAVGVDPFCFTTPNIAPMNPGPFLGTFSSLWHGSETLGFERICAFITPESSLGKAVFEQVVSAWEGATGKQLALYDDSLTRGQMSYAGNVAQIGTNNCDAIFTNEVGAIASQILAEATNQGIDLPVLALTSTYSQEFVDTLAYGGDLHVPAEFSPWSDPEDSSNVEWAAVMEAHGIGLTSFAQGGYLAAKAFIHILENEVGAEDEVTRENFTAAAKNMTKGFDTGGMTAEAWVFGPGDFHQPNVATWEVSIMANSGTWSSIGPWFLASENGWVDTVIPSS